MSESQLDKLLECYGTGKQFGQLLPPMTACIEESVSKLDRNMPTSFALQHQYKMHLHIAVMFTSNKAELGSARAEAKAYLQHELYKDVITDLYEIRGYVREPEVLTKIEKLLTKLKGN